MRHSKRVILVACCLFGLFSVLMVQFFRVQVVQENKWQRFAKAQHELVVKEPFKRGCFYSNVSVAPEKNLKPQALVVDIPMYHLYADPFQIPSKKREEIVEQLEKKLSLEKGEVEKAHYSLGVEKSRSRKIKMWLTQAEKNDLSSWWFSYAKKNKIARNALYFVSDYKRSYPYDSLLGPLLHTIREAKEETTHQGIPTGGLEYYFNQTLSGIYGKKKLLRSPKHPLELGKIIEEPQNGADVYLTINHHLQAIAEEEIKKGVEFYGAKSGWAILMDPYTGEVLAFAQYPFFAPAEYKKYFKGNDDMEFAKLKGICDSFEPGSIMKPITMAICFLANEELQKRGKPPILDVNEKMPVSSGKFPGRTRDLKDPTRAHKYLNFYQALQKSANIYPARLIERVINELGEQWYREQMVSVFKLGEKTGIEYPMEAEGLIPTPGKLNPNGTLEWSTPTPFSMAMGHNYMVNSLQMIRAFASIANGGFLIEPTFVRKISQKDKDGSEKVLLDHTSEKRLESFPRILKPYMVEEITKGLKYTMSKGGSGRRADVYGYTVAGKSGTANKIVKGQYSKNSYFSSFIGFAPANHPRFVLLVSMDDLKDDFKHGIGYTYYGGKCAGPVFREIARRALQYLGVKPDNPNHYPPGDPRSKPKEAHWAKESQELNALYEKWNLKN